MAKKNLKHQIEQVSFWFVSGVFWYLVIAFFLKSKYPINEYVFNPATAYDVVKDALTLAAAFLAPVMAFVIFSDWRDQSKYNNFLKEVESVGKLFEELLKIGRIELGVFSSPNNRISAADYNRVQSSISALNHCNISMAGFEDRFLKFNFNEYDEKAKSIHSALLECSQTRADMLDKLTKLFQSTKPHYSVFINKNTNTLAYVKSIQQNLDDLELKEREIQGIYALLISMN